ncbi:GTP 3',8-cyclase MoaA [Leifsonia sp. A12D58]|uniref:GTP 3',8-cyclase MoaA n=1 Tax=Leifsonia sp. A12D58 TaxID=3397674 RepID=UPI0039E0B96D
MGSSPDYPLVRDARGRALRDLRISVTDRCNFRCVYCMPKEIFGRDFQYLPKSSLLTFEEITRLAGIAALHGVEKIRLTGGEPLLRVGLPDLVGMLSAIRTSDGHPLDIAVTTNGSALAHLAPALKEAGMSRVTVSLDSLDNATFTAMNDVDFPVSRVLKGIDAARDAGLAVKVNMVVKRGFNDQDILPMARHFKGTGHILRFIEYMDVGSTNGWTMNEVVPSADVIARITAEMPLEVIVPNYSGETAARWRYQDGGGEIGVISSVTQSFCGSCTRVRVSTEGRLFTCLFATEGHDLRGLMRSGCSDEQLGGFLANIWRARDDRYSELRSAQTPSMTGRAKKIEMSYIGG